MEALSASRYVVDSYGFCGQSVLTRAARSSGQSLIKTKTLRWIDRLRVARDLARGLADLHALVAHDWHDGNHHHDHHHNNKPFPLVFAHHDVNPANLIAVGSGQIQWNDFNLGLVNRYYRGGVQQQQQQQQQHESGNNGYNECPVPIRYEQLLWRSPEECRNETGTLVVNAGVDTNPNRNPNRNDAANNNAQQQQQRQQRRRHGGKNTASQAADVYSLGNILFYVLARHQPWSHLEEGGKPTITGQPPPPQNGSTPIAIAKLDTASTPRNKQESLAAIARAKGAGVLPHLPERYLARGSEAGLLWKAVTLCYHHDPGARPSALEVANFLGDAIASVPAAHNKKRKRNRKQTKAKQTNSQTKE